jgi:SAM-dependent methyltransferase
MDAGESSAIHYATHHFCNPLAPETLDRALAFVELAPGDAAVDLGCGNGMVALHLAERLGLAVEAVDIAPQMLALARARVGERGAPGSVTLREASADAVLSEGRRWKLVLATGSWGLVDGRPEPERILARLAEAAESGGYVLWGDPFLKAPPEARLAMLLQAADFRPHAEYVSIGEAAGLEPVYAAVSTDQDWDEYAWRIHHNTVAWARSNPDHPEAAAQVQRAQMMLTLHLEEGRQALGFGLYLFRKP